MLTPGDVAGKQVGGELDAVADPVDALRDRPRERGLAGAGEVLEQQVALAEERDEAEPHDEGLAEQHLLDVRDETSEGLLEPGGLFGGHGHLGDVLSGRGQNSCHEYSLV